MAAKPVERHIKRQIHEQGGWARILERIASGETVADIARTLLKPDGTSISRNFFSMMLHADEERSKRVFKLREEEVPDALVDDALHAVDVSPMDRDGTNHGKVRAELKLKVAGFMNRQRWGEQRQPTVQLTVNQNSLHLDALRHRIIEASRPLAAGSPPVIPLAAQTAESATLCACETDTHQASSAEEKPKELTPGSVESQKAADAKWLRESA